MCQQRTGHILRNFQTFSPSGLWPPHPYDSRPMGKRPKRENGAGSLEELKDGRWRVRLTVETSMGVRRKAFTAKTKKAVVAKRDAYLKDREGIAFDAEKVTVSDYLDRWLRDHVSHQRRPSTYVEYESAVRVHLKPALGTIKLQKLGPVHVEGLLSEKRREGYAEGTCRRIYAILGAAMTQALKWRLVNSNPVTPVDAPKTPQRTTRMALTAEEVSRLFDAAKAWRGGRLYPILLLAVSTGMRQGEILALLWEDVEGRPLPSAGPSTGTGRRTRPGAPDMGHRRAGRRGVWKWMPGSRRSSGIIARGSSRSAWPQTLGRRSTSLQRPKVNRFIAPFCFSLSGGCARGRGCPRSPSTSSGIPARRWPPSARFTQTR